MIIRGSYPWRALVDAGAWLALADDRDDNHQAALAIQREIAAQGSRLFVTNYLIDETYTLMLARMGYRFAVRFLDDVKAGTVTTVRLTAADEQRAEQMLRQYDDKRFSYTDATSFAVMERLAIEAAFTFDKNFTEYGRIVVLGR